MSTDDALYSSRTETLPIIKAAESTAPIVVVAATYRDQSTGALYVHKDLDCVVPAWEVEAHLGPVKETARFGDVESWTDYVKRFSGADSKGPFLTWNASGLRAVLDYPVDHDTPGRSQWVAQHPFEPSLQWRQWQLFTAGAAFSQKTAIERLEDLAEDIKEPAPADLVALLRSLRASMNARADTDLRPDGTTSVKFSKDTAVKSGMAEGSVDLPGEIGIAIPVLKGHVDAEGRPVLYRIGVRLRVNVDDNAHLMFRFTIPSAERVLESVYADRVKHAAALLGDEYQLLRAAD